MRLCMQLFVCHESVCVYTGKVGCHQSPRSNVTDARQRHGLRELDGGDVAEGQVDVVELEPRPVSVLGLGGRRSKFLWMG